MRRPSDYPRVGLDQPIEAQGLNDVLGGLLSQGCRRLGGTVNFGIPVGVVTGPFGPELSLLCQGLGAATTSSATLGEENRIGTEESADIHRRLRQRQDSDHGVSGFVGGGYQAFSEDTTRFSSGFDGDAERAVIGADYRFPEGHIVGIAGSYRHRDGHYDSGGRFDQNVYGLFLYGSLVPAPRVFIDGVVGYSRQHYSLDRDVAFTGSGFPFMLGVNFSTSGMVRADTDGGEVEGRIDGGYDFVFGHFTAGPRMGVRYRETTIDAFRETGQTGLELQYENQRIRSLVTTAGVIGSVAFNTQVGVVAPYLSAEYVHEFLDDQRKVGFRLVQDLSHTRFEFQTAPPQRDYANLGAGLTMVLSHGLHPFVDFQQVVGYRDRQSYTVSGGLRISF